MKEIYTILDIENILSKQTYICCKSNEKLEQPFSIGDFLKKEEKRKEDTIDKINKNKI